jgi:hypothetical protein
LTQVEVASALGLSEGTVRSWEADPPRAPSPEQRTLLLELFRQAQSVNALPPASRAAIATVEEFAESESRATRVQAFNYWLNAEAGPRARGDVRFLEDTVLTNLAAGHSYEYVLAPPAWLDPETWFDFVSNQISDFYGSYVTRVRNASSGRLKFTLLSSGADCTYSFDLHRRANDEITAFVCEEVVMPERLRPDAQRMFFRITDSSKAISVWQWLRNMSRQVGVVYEPSKAIIPDVREEFISRFQARKCDWSFIRLLFHDEVRRPWSEHLEKRISG